MSVHPSEEKNKNNIDGRIIIASPFERHDTLAQIDALSSFEFQRIKDHRELNIDFLSTLSPTWIFFPHWSHIIPENVYGSFKCVVFHMTNLPFGRGGSPLQNMIIQGLTHTKLSALAVGQGIDTGPVYCKRPLSLHGTADEIFDRAVGLMAPMMTEIVLNTPTPKEQTGSPTIFKRRTPSDSDMEAISGTDAIYDHIRMLDAQGYPNAFVKTRSMVYEFSNAEKSVDGTIIAKVRISKNAN